MFIKATVPCAQLHVDGNTEADSNDIIMCPIYLFVDDMFSLSIVLLLSLFMYKHS